MPEMAMKFSVKKTTLTLNGTRGVAATAPASWIVDVAADHQHDHVRREPGYRFAGPQHRYRDDRREDSPQDDAARRDEVADRQLHHERKEQEEAELRVLEKVETRR